VARATAIGRGGRGRLPGGGGPAISGPTSTVNRRSSSTSSPCAWPSASARAHCRPTP
jgi:hypothetical protein